MPRWGHPSATVQDVSVCPGPETAVTETEGRTGDEARRRQAWSLFKVLKICFSIFVLMVILDWLTVSKKMTEKAKYYYQQQEQLQASQSRTNTLSNIHHDLNPSGSRKFFDLISLSGSLVNSWNSRAPILFNSYSCSIISVHDMTCPSHFLFLIFIRMPLLSPLPSSMMFISFVLRGRNVLMIIKDAVPSQ